MVSVSDMWVIGVGVIDEMSMASACRLRDVVEMGRRLIAMSICFPGVQRIPNIPSN